MRWNCLQSCLCECKHGCLCNSSMHSGTVLAFRLLVAGAKGVDWIRGHGRLCAPASSECEGIKMANIMNIAPMAPQDVVDQVHAFRGLPLALSGGSMTRLGWMPERVCAVRSSRHRVAAHAVRYEREMPAFPELLHHCTTRTTTPCERSFRLRECHHVPLATRTPRQAKVPGQHISPDEQIHSSRPVPGVQWRVPT